MSEGAGAIEAGRVNPAGESIVTIAANVAPAPRTVSWLGADYTIIVERGESGGSLGMFQSTVPAGYGPPLHIHNNEDELIHVLEGAYEFWLDGGTCRKGPGEAIFLPRGVPHTFRVVSAGPGKNLTVLTPGGFETFFRDAAARDLRFPADPRDVAALSERYALQFLGPAAWAA